MMLMAQGNVKASFSSVLNRDENELAEVEKTEEYIDFLNKEISLHVSRLIAYETNEQASAVVSSFFTISGNIERIGDHADNLAGYTRLLNKRNISFSEAGSAGDCRHAGYMFGVRGLSLDSVGWNCGVAQ